MHIDGSLIAGIISALLFILSSIAILLWKFSSSHTTLINKIDQLIERQEIDRHSINSSRSELQGTIKTVEINMHDSLRALSQKVDTYNVRLFDFSDRLARIEERLRVESERRDKEDHGN